MGDFLLDLEHGSKRLFFKSGHDTYAYKILFIYVKFKGGGFNFEIL